MASAWDTSTEAELSTHLARVSAMPEARRRAGAVATTAWSTTTAYGLVGSATPYSQVPSLEYTLERAVHAAQVAALVGTLITGRPAR
ncbi:hypothetical protein D3C86_1367280 [compost metagenome]